MKPQLLTMLLQAVSTAPTATPAPPTPLGGYDSYITMLNLTAADLELIIQSFNLTSMHVNLSELPAGQGGYSGPGPGGIGAATSRPPGTACYCGGKIREIATAYKTVHGYLALVVCLFGFVANLLNVMVLTRKELAGAPINRILTWLAVADMLVMAEYVPFACYMYLVLPGRKDFPRGWAVFILFHSNFTTLLHTISIFLTIALAVWRFISIRYPQHTHTLCSSRRCTLAIACSFVLPAVVCVPSFLVFSIKETTVTEDQRNVTLFHIDLSDVAKGHGEVLYILNLWVYSVIIKLLPCLLLTLISFWLIKALYRANRRKAALRGYSACAVLSATQNGGGSGGGGGGGGGDPEVKRLQHLRRPTRAERRTDRTTKMLLSILGLFLLTEFPQGILGLLSGIMGHCFFRYCYTLFGEMMDILALLNGAINFILYCAMSRQFRTTFGQLFGRMFEPRGLIAKLQGAATSQTEVHSTYV